MRDEERDLPELLPTEPASSRHDEFGAFLREVSGAVGEALQRHSHEQRLAQAIMRWEGDGFRTARLEAGLADGSTADEVDRLIASFENDVARLRALSDDIRMLDAAAPELARADVLLDPDRVGAAERLVARVRERLARVESDDAENDGDVAGRPGVGSDGHPARPRWRGDGEATAMLDGAAPTAPTAALPEVGVIDRWFLSPDKVVWRWPYVEDRIVTTDE